MMKQLPYDKELFDTEDEVFVSEDKLTLLGYRSFDAKYGVFETLQLIDEQLKVHGLEIEVIETNGSWYCWRIISIQPAEKP